MTAILREAEYCLQASILAEIDPLQPLLDLPIGVLLLASESQATTLIVTNNHKTGTLTFFNELKRRNVFRAGIGYGVVGWLLIQVAETILPIFEIPTPKRTPD